jgi:hypothetical protein
MWQLPEYPIGLGDKIIFTPGNGNTIYLDRHRLNCGGAGNAMEMFKLERSWPNRIRYKYTCCQLSAGTCSTRKETNDYTSDGGGKVVYLDR